MLHSLIRFSAFILLMALGYSCNSEKGNSQQSFKSPIQQTPQFSGQVVRLENTTFYAYQIKKDGKMVINQSFLPAIQGKLPIEDSIWAVRLMQKSLEEITKGQFPPSLSVQEVNNCIGALN